jgi:uncharacterized protein (TIGR03435 family)
VKTLTIVTVLAAAVHLAAQQPPAAPVAPAFDAVVIKRNTSGERSASVGSRPGGVFTMVNARMAAVFSNGYPSQSGEVVGAPDWFNTDRYDITAKIVGNPTVEQERDLWRALFAERMKLKAHYETKEQPTYALMLARSDGRLGPNLKKANTDCDARRAAIRRGEQPPQPPPASNGQPGCSTRMSASDSTLMQAGGQTMAAFGRSLAGLAGRFIVDQTGLARDYEYTLEFAAPPRPGEPVSGDKTDLFTALREQLGLKLESTRTRLDYVVIDHIEPPTTD